jgi:ATP phosphoribosyltransferase
VQVPVGPQAAQAQAAQMTVAVPKGRLLAGTLELLERLGLAAPRFSDRSLWEVRQGVGYLLVRSRDVPFYVRSGAADLGVVGRDVLMEHGEGLVPVADLPFGRCRLVLATLPGQPLRPDMRVATRYPHLARQLLGPILPQLRVVYLHGAVEAAPQAGLAEAVLDVAETGQTLRAQGLEVRQVVLESWAVAVARSWSGLSPVAQELAQKMAQVSRGA